MSGCGKVEMSSRAGGACPATGGQSPFSQTIYLRQGHGGQAAKKGMVPGVARASRMALKPRRMAGCPWRAVRLAYCGECRCRMEGPGFPGRRSLGEGGSPARVGRGPAPRSAVKPMLLEVASCGQTPRLPNVSAGNPASPRLRRTWGACRHKGRIGAAIFLSPIRDDRRQECRRPCRGGAGIRQVGTNGVDCAGGPPVAFQKCRGRRRRAMALPCEGGVRGHFRCCTSRRGRPAHVGLP